MSHGLDKTFNAEQNTLFRKVTVATKITRKEEESHGTQLLTAQRLAAVTKHIHHLSDELPWKKNIFFIHTLPTIRTPEQTRE